MPPWLSEGSKFWSGNDGSERPHRLSLPPSATAPWVTPLVLEGACQRHGVGGFLEQLTIIIIPRQPHGQPQFPKCHRRLSARAHSRVSEPSRESSSPHSPTPLGDRSLALRSPRTTPQRYALVWRARGDRRVRARSSVARTRGRAAFSHTLPLSLSLSLARSLSISLSLSLSLFLVEGPPRPRARPAPAPPRPSRARRTRS